MKNVSNGSCPFVCFQMVLVAIFSETGFFDYCAVKVKDVLTMLALKMEINTSVPDIRSAVQELSEIV